MLQQNFNHPRRLVRGLNFGPVRPEWIFPNDRRKTGCIKQWSPAGHVHCFDFSSVSNQLLHQFRRTVQSRQHQRCDTVLRRRIDILRGQREQPPDQLLRLGGGQRHQQRRSADPIPHSEVDAVPDQQFQQLQLARSPVPILGIQQPQQRGLTVFGNRQLRVSAVVQQKGDHFRRHAEAQRLRQHRIAGKAAVDVQNFLIQQILQQSRAANRIDQRPDLPRTAGQIRAFQFRAVSNQKFGICQFAGFQRPLSHRIRRRHRDAFPHKHFVKTGQFRISRESDTRCRLASGSQQRFRQLRVNPLRPVGESGRPASRHSLRPGAIPQQQPQLRIAAGIVNSGNSLKITGIRISAMPQQKFDRFQRGRFLQRDDQGSSASCAADVEIRSVLLQFSQHRNSAVLDRHRKQPPEIRRRPVAEQQEYAAAVSVALLRIRPQPLATQLFQQFQ